MQYVRTVAPQFAEQTLIDGGDCKDTSILLAGMLKSVGYKVALIGFNAPAGETEGHMIVGVHLETSQIPAGTTAWSFAANGVTYYDAETTSPGWNIGDRGLLNSNLESQGYVNPL